MPGPGFCPHCGRFLAQLQATTTAVTGGEALDSISGYCHLHGWVEAEGEFWWEDFFGEGQVEA